MDLAQQQYNSISYYYEILYAGFDITQFGKEFISQHKEYLDKLPVNAKICDCSCGNGFQAIALKKEGFNILATDISDEMVRLTLKNAQDNNVEFPVKRFSWKELPDHYSDQFDSLFCWGNSISHSLSKKEMIENLKAMYLTLKTKGKFFIETRNWDKLVREKKRYYNYDIKEYNGNKYLPFYIMNIGSFDEHCNLEMVFIQIKEDLKTESVGFNLDFMPFRHSDFVNRLKETGFTVLKDTYNESGDFYYLVLEK